MNKEYLFLDELNLEILEQLRSEGLIKQLEFAFIDIQLPNTNPTPRGNKRKPPVHSTLNDKVVRTQHQLAKKEPLSRKVGEDYWLISSIVKRNIESELGNHLREKTKRKIPHEITRIENDLEKHFYNKEIQKKILIEEIQKCNSVKATPINRSKPLSLLTDYDMICFYQNLYHSWFENANKRKLEKEINEIVNYDVSESLFKELKIKYDKLTSNKPINSHELDHKTLLMDLIDISSQLLERKYTVRLENLITDNFTDGLRNKGYNNITDETRSGRSSSKKSSGELDIMIRDDRNRPFTIIEALRLESFNSNNRPIIEHINKLLIDYDTNGLSTNYIFVYSLTKDFHNSWSKYQKYISNLNNHQLYDQHAKLSSYEVKEELSKVANIKILLSKHSRNENISNLYHIFINMDIR